MMIGKLIDMIEKNECGSYGVAKIIIDKGIGYLARIIGVKKRGSVKELDEKLFSEIKKALLTDDYLFLPSDFDAFPRVSLEDTKVWIKIFSVKEKWIDDTAEYIIQLLAEEREFVISRALKSRIKLYDDYDVLLDGDDSEEQALGVLLWASYIILKERYYKYVRKKLMRDPEIRKKYQELINKSYEVWLKCKERARILLKEKRLCDAMISLAREFESLKLARDIMVSIHPEKKEEIDICYDNNIFSFDW